MKEILKEFCKSLNIEYVGIAPPGPYHVLADRWKKRLEQGHVTGFEEKDFAKRIDARLTLEDAQTVVVCLFPYLTDVEGHANLSRSSFSSDYHMLVKSKLEQIGAFLTSLLPDFEYKSFVDNGPLADRYVAYLAGLGFFGVNSHLINEKYGSYVFIGYIITNYPFEIDHPIERTCLQCGRCAAHCPGKAILGDFDINPLRCRSYLTQKKGELNAAEEEILRGYSLLYGCDICQEVCPHNKDCSQTPLEEFKNELKTNLAPEELTELSNKEFLRRYRNRAFAWRGKGMLLRNYNIINKDK